MQIDWVIYGTLQAEGEDPEKVTEHLNAEELVKTSTVRSINYFHDGDSISVCYPPELKEKTAQP